MTVSKETIAKFVVTQAPPTPPSKRKRLTEDQENRIVELRKQGMTIRAIAEAVKRSKFFVHKHI